MSGPYDLEEQERLDAIRHWWEDNARLVYAAVVALLLAVGGWRGYVFWSNTQKEEASALGAGLAKARGDAKATAELAQQLADKHPRSFAASDASLAAAQAAFDAGDLAGAQARLEWVLKNGRDEHRGVARLRLAAVLLDQKKPAEALSTLEANTDEAYGALVADMRGDILFSQGRLDEARAAYKLALDKASPRNPLRNLTELKLGALGGPT